MGNSKYLKGACLKIQSPGENTTQTANMESEKVQIVDLQPEQSKTFVRYGLSTLQVDETKGTDGGLLMTCFIINRIHFQLSLLQVT